MKIVTWNCNGALRKKIEPLESLNADIYVIQECEDPAQSTKQYKNWAGEYLWEGENKNKGVGIFSKKHLLEKSNWSGNYDLFINKSTTPTLSWNSKQLQTFLPCTINNDLQLLAVWTKKNSSPNFGYIGQLWLYLQIFRKNLSHKKQIICGDLNSNTIWDEWDRWWSHSNVVDELRSIGIESLYHYQYVEKQGEEKRPTFFHQKKQEKTYHIDYVFLQESLMKKANLEIMKPDIWLQYSDHMPLVFEI